MQEHKAGDKQEDGDTTPPLCPWYRRQWHRRRRRPGFAGGASLHIPQTLAAGSTRQAGAAQRAAAASHHHELLLHRVARPQQVCQAQQPWLRAADLLHLHHIILPAALRLLLLTLLLLLLLRLLLLHWLLRLLLLRLLRMLLLLLLLHRPRLLPAALLGCWQHQPVALLEGARPAKHGRMGWKARGGKRGSGGRAAGRELLECGTGSSRAAGGPPQAAPLVATTLPVCTILPASLLQSRARRLHHAAPPARHRCLPLPPPLLRRLVGCLLRAPNCRMSHLCRSFRLLHRCAALVTPLLRLLQLNLRRGFLPLL